MKSKILCVLFGIIIASWLAVVGNDGDVYAVPDQTCVSNGYFGNWQGGSINNAIEAIYGICDFCSTHNTPSSGALYVGVWPNGSYSNPYTDGIELKVLTSNETVYLWSQMLNCYSSAIVGVDPTFDDLKFITTGFDGAFPFIRQTNYIRNWANLSGLTYGYSPNQWYRYGSASSATFDSYSFSKSGNVQKACSTVSGEDYDLCTFSFTTRGKSQDMYAHTILVWHGYKGVAPYNIKVQVKQVHLWGIAVDLDGNFIDIGIIQKAEAVVEYDALEGGKYAEITRTSPPDKYTFRGWRKEPTSSIFSEDIKYSDTISKNTTVYAVYEKEQAIQNYTLTGESINTSGGTLNSVPGLERRTDSVKQGETARVSHGTNSEYTFICWKADRDPNSSCIGDGSEYVKKNMQSNVTVYAVFKKRVYYTLTAKSVTESGVSLSSVSGLGDRSDGPVEDGQTARVTHGTNGNYTFVCWKETNNSGAACVSPVKDEYSRVMHSDFTVYAVYQKDVMSARIDTYLRGVLNRIEYTSEGKTARYELKDCSPIEGCDASFKHYLKGSGVSGSINYKVARRSNYTAGGIDTRQLKSASFNRLDTAGREVYADNSLKLYPGQVVCETLEFNPYNDGNKVTLESCVSATGYAQPLKK